MSDAKEIYKDSDVRIVEHKVKADSSPDQYRTIVMEIAGKEFGYEFAFGTLIHTWQRWKK